MVSPIIIIKIAMIKCDVMHIEKVRLADVKSFLPNSTFMNLRVAPDNALLIKENKTIIPPTILYMP